MTDQPQSSSQIRSVGIGEEYIRAGEKAMKAIVSQPQPGRELDEAIARLLGWERQVVPPGSLGSKIYQWIAPDGVERKNPPPISTDDATAFVALEQLCKSKEWNCEIERIAGCDATVIINRDPDDLLDSNDLSALHLANSRDFAHAAAFAILAALEAEKCN